MQGIEDPAIRLFGKKIPLSGADAATCEVKWMDEEGDDVGEKEQRMAIDAQSQSQVLSVDAEHAEKLETSKSMKDVSGTPDSRGKTLKKPDKIFPCPRCDSMDTKFCYYNNYNVNQPRHFCRACQRYWTAGGSMRNMPVGAGRRKNKRAACHYRNIMIAGGFNGAKVNVSDCIRLHDFKSNGTAPRFGVDTGKPGNEYSRASSITISSSSDNGSTTFTLQERKELNCNEIPSQIPSLPGFPWSYRRNPTVPPPALYPAAAFWTWNVPLVLLHQLSSTVGLKTSVAITDPAIPGKRSREPELEVKSTKQGNSCPVVPKTLCLDDPGEAAKSSIWTSLGIAHNSNTKGLLFSCFKQKGVEKGGDDEKLRSLHVNTVALSRSRTFH